MKKVIKKLASLLMVTVFVITGTTFQMLAGALSESVINGKQKLYISYYPYSYNFSGSGLGTSIYGQFVKINVGSANGEYAYCMDAEADSGITGTSIFTAEDFNLSDWVKRNYTSNQIKLMKYAAIYTIKNASETKYGYSNEVENIASQIINWTILHNWFNTSSESSVLNVYTANMPSSVASNVKACYNKIKEQILSHKTIPSFAVGKGQTPTPKKMTTNADGTFSITLTDNKNCSSYFDWAKALNNSKYKNYLSITTNSAGKLVIKSTKPIPKSDEFELTAKKTKSKYQNELDTASPVALIVDESQLSGQNAVGYTNTDNDPVTASISLYTDTIGTAQIKKVWQHNNDTSSTKADNSDIYFTIKNSSGSAVKATGKAGSYTYSTSGSVSQFKLNSSNTFLVKSLPAGTYTVYEFGNDGNGIPNYTRKNLSQTVTVTAGGTGTVTFKNTRNTGTGKVIKTWVDTNGNAIAASNNVERNKQIYFRIKNADGKYITVNGTKYSGSYTFTGTSTKATSLYVNPGTGTFTVSDLPTGKYTVYEYGSPDGYSVNRASQTITISRDKTSSVSFVNSEDSGTAQIKKVWLSDTTLSASEKANLEKNVYFTVKDSDGKYIKVTGSAGAYAYAGTQTTANNLKLSGSKFNVSKLPMGTYTVTEINNASGYNPKTQTKTVTIANKGETKSVSFTNKSTPVVVIRKHFSDENNLTEAQLKEQYAKVTVNLQVLGFGGSVSSNPPAGYYVEFTGSNGNYTYKGLSSTKTSATNLKLNENGEMTISFGTNTAPYYLAVIETYSGTDYDVDNRDQRIDLGNGDPNAVIDLDDIELDNQLKTGSVQIDKQFLNENGAIENIPDDKLAEVAFKIKHNGKYLTFTGSNGSYTYKGENNTGTELKLNKATYNFIANELPAREEYTVYEVSGTTGYSFSIDPVTFEVTPNGTVKKVFTNKAMTGTISIVKHSADGVLSGWQFRVTGTAKTGQSYDKTFTTDAKGTITISNIRIGDYKVTEVKTGKTVGYITENSKDLEVKTDTVTTVNIENKPYANIVINKVDSVKGTALSGATFGIYTDAECEIPAQAYTSATDDTLTDAEITESATGKYTCNYLPISSATGTTYYVKELTAPEHYAIDTDVHPVTLKTANSTVAVSNNATSKFYETPLGSVRTTKVDADHPDVLLSGAEFTVYQSDKATVYGKLAETSKGTYQLNEIPAGTYYLRETKAPKYYNIDNTFYQFTISDAGKVVDVSINGNDKFPNAPQKGDIKIVKRSADGVLSGWKFEVSGTALNGTPVATKTYTTDAKGEINISNLLIGTYTVKEVKDGKTVGYITPANQTIEVKSNATTTATFENKPFGHIVINKVDAKTGEKVTGATFGIYTDSTCKTVAKAYKSDTDSTLVNAEIIETATGVYTCNNLPISSATGTTYYVKELTAPEGYYLDTDVHPVTLKTANATVSVSNEIGKSDFKEYPYGHGAVIKEWKLDNSTADMTADEIAQMKAELEKSLYFTVKDSNGKYITATGADGVYTYNGESTTEFRYVLKNSTFTIAELPTGDYTITEYSTLLDYTIKSENPVKITVVRNQTATATFVNERDTGNASIIKKWTNPNGLTTAQKAELEKNVYFTVKNADGAYLKAVSKNGKYVYNGSQTAEARFMLTNGKFELTELPTGKYTITEINNAEGYLPKTQVKTITVTKDATASAEFVNKVIVGNVTLTKVDEDYPENKLTGAVFTVYKSDKKTVVGTLKETETGVYSLEGLVYGDYYVQETKAPEYFVRDVNFYYFEIVNDGETVEVSNDELGKGTFINSPQKGEIKIVKTSYDNKVEGIHFEVTGKTYTGQTFKKTYTTDKNGIIRINDLRAGEYNIHEVNDEASAGYLLPEDKQLTIDRDGAMLVAEMHNSKLPDNPPTGASEDSFTQTAVIIISMVMMSAAVVLVFPLSKRKRKR
ncbi:SpaA isopeptide-forming pilin-related protein [[Eubacterium] siraeum]|uniref:SpaA isopeptide-forming pilin-related protein n=1 Tax=[Eubacterium] siraeum TaxID=39492 RepID=A0AAW6D2P8_9FIRM|nr:SpaA isopeptide-forming pilin-related protein [[Eubacterium] siraeum]MDB8004899.1 SpaA isopeptide-forming pilin-related protein [[Eubacterium] siraeum]